MPLSPKQRPLTPTTPARGRDRPATPGRGAGPALRVVAALALAAAGTLAVASALTPNIHWRNALLSQLEPHGARHFGHVLAGMAGIALLGLALGVWRGQRRAAEAAIVVLVIVAVLDAIKGLDYEESVLALALAWLLYSERAAFQRGADLRPGFVSGTVAVGAIITAYAVSVTTELVTGRNVGIGRALSRGLHGLVMGGWFFNSSEPSSIALDVLVILGLAAGALWLVALLRPGRAVDGHSEEDHRRAAEIVGAWGDDSLAPFSLREDKAIFFAAEGLLTYRVVQGTAVVSGDPIAPPARGPEVLAAFAEHATRQNWSVALTGAAEHHLRAYARLGFRALHIGNEAWVDPRSFSLEGRRIRKVRQSLHRAERQGWSFTVLRGSQLDRGQVAGLEAVEQQWRRAQRRLQGFAMTLGHLWRGDEDEADLYVLGTSPQGEIRAFLRFVPFGRGYSLDVMRRLDEKPNGLIEAMVALALLEAGRCESQEVSLNFAGFAHVMAADAALSRGQRVLRWLLRRLHGRFQLERLMQFNEKFDPSWRPRFLVYAGRRGLPTAGWRVLQAEAYVPGPRGRPLKSRWSPPEASAHDAAPVAR